ncbi:MAG: hypothetical protein II993_02485 [Anaerotignum sp.]|nr:hypothetical protein [Anaerotignum sp.]
MDKNTNKEEQLQKALHHLMCAGNHLNVTGLSSASGHAKISAFNKVETHSNEAEETDCVVLRYSDFSQLMQDLIDLGDMNDTLMQMLGAKEHLARTLLGVACKMDTSAHEKQEKQHIREHTDAILNKWSNATLTVMEH